MGRREQRLCQRYQTLGMALAQPQTYVCSAAYTSGGVLCTNAVLWLATGRSPIRSPSQMLERVHHFTGAHAYRHARRRQALERTIWCQLGVTAEAANTRACQHLQLVQGVQATASAGSRGTDWGTSEVGRQPRALASLYTVLGCRLCYGRHCRGRCRAAHGLHVTRLQLRA